MIVQIPKNIDDTKPNIFLGLSIEKGISVVGMAAVVILWVVNGRTLPTPILIAILTFIGFLGFFNYQGMNGLKFLLTAVKHFVTGTCYLFEKMFSKTSLTPKETKKINKRLQKELKNAKRKNLAHIEPVTYANTKKKRRK